MGTNQNVLGSVVYKVYVKQSNGSLTQINGNDHTSTTYTGEVPAGVAGHSATFVVKASYSNYNALSSGGVEVTVDASSVKYDFDIQLQGGTNTSGVVGTYVEQGVKVYSNSKDVTKDCSIKTYVNGVETKNISLTTAGNYTIEYKVTYKGETKTATRNVTLK